ncbi:hypothetical protein BDN67DRAFT_909969, partial [Paxillus ammoniavirescens]
CYRVMGRWFTFNLALLPEHKLITSGPYTIVQYLSYTGRYLTFSGWKKNTQTHLHDSATPDLSPAPNANNSLISSKNTALFLPVNTRAPQPGSNLINKRTCRRERFRLNRICVGVRSHDEYKH